MWTFLESVDRRWIFLLMALSVAIPILLESSFPEKATGLAVNVFEEIDNLPEGSTLLMSYDYDPASEGELGPMATTFCRHACEKKHKMVFMALWPVGPQMVDDTIEKVIKRDFPELVYGVDYCNLGYKSGNEGVIKVIVTDLRQLYTTDARGTSIDAIPMMRSIRSVQDFDLLINVSAGYAGTKEWVQYAASAFPDKIKMVAGCTGVQAPLLYPYIPEQLPGLLGAIKGAAEYELLVLSKYGVMDANGKPDIPANPGLYREGIRRMGPQLIAHVLMIILIIVGNLVFFHARKEGRA